MYVELGKIVGVWGVKGWVKLHSYTRNREDIANYPNWWLRGKNSNLEPALIDVIKCRAQGQGMVAQLTDINDRDQAASLIGQIILVPQSQLPQLSDGEYYWQQLIGLSVANSNNQQLGKVSSILETGANDVLVIKPTEVDKADILIPYTDVVQEIDLAAGTMLVDWDPSYLED